MLENRKNRVAIIGGMRTPFAKAGTAFARYSALDLAIHSVKGLLETLELSGDQLDEVAYSTVAPNPMIPHFAREVVLQGGLVPSTRALTVANNCISGASAIASVFDGIASGRANVGLAGGAESMSNPPITVAPETARRLQEVADADTDDARIAILRKLDPKALTPSAGGLREPSTGLTMGEHTERTVKEWKITRKDQDALAYRSHRNAYRATMDGRLREEIWSLDGAGQDQQIRAETSPEKLAALKPVFDPTPGGTITAGNASPLTDGAASILLSSERYAQENQVEPLAFIKDFEFAAIDPNEGLLMAPAIAVPRLLKRNGFDLSDIDILEMHEAFAGQVLANIRAWEIGWKGDPVGPVDVNKLNPLGSSIAVGHPLAATAVRIITTLANEMKRRDARYGLASICAAGGLAAALLLERP